MATTWKCAAVLSAALALASCSGTTSPYAGAGPEAYDSGGVDTNWVWAGLALALLFAYSTN